jgi:hypothetical protein
MADQYLLELIAMDHLVVSQTDYKQVVSTLEIPRIIQINQVDWFDQVLQHSIALAAVPQHSAAHCSIPQYSTVSFTLLCI